MNLRGLCLLIWTFSGSILWAQGLSFEDLLEQAKKTDPEYAVIASEEKKLAYYIDEALPTRQVLLNVNGEKGFSSGSDQDTLVLSGELAKSFIETGTDVSISQSKTTRPDREENVTQIRLDQSLLKDAFGRDVRLKKSALNDEVKTQFLEFQESYESYVAQILNEFLNYEIAKENHVLSQTIYDSAIELEKIVLSKYRLSIASQTDLNRAKLATVLRQEDLLAKKQNYDNLKQALEKRLNLKDIQIKNGEKEKLLQFLNQQTQTQDQQNIEQYRSMNISELNQRIAQKNSKILKRSLSPDLNFVLGYNIDDSSRFNTTTERKETVIGFILSVPFFNSKAKAQSALANIEFLKMAEEKRAAKIEFERSQDQLKINLEGAKQQKELSEKKIKLIESILKDEEKRFRIGSRTLEDLIELRNDHAEYQNQYQQAVLNYSQQMISWLSLHDQLLGFEKNI